MADVGLGRFRSRRRTLGVLAAVALVVAACGGDGGDADRPGATVPEESSPSGTADGTTSTTSASAADAAAAIDITTKPATVTVEYADAVMDELDRILSEAIREFVAADGPTKSFDDKLNAVYDEPSLENKRQVYGELAIDGADEYKKPPGDVETMVREILKSEPGCVIALVERTFAAALLSVDSTARRTSYIALAPSVRESDPLRINGSAWSIVFDGNVLDGEDPKAAC